MSDDAAGGAGDARGGRDDSTARFGDDFVAQLAAYGAELAPEEAAAVGALPSGSAILIIHHGPDAGARFLLDADAAVAGRHPDAQIFLDDVTVSRRHAEFIRRGTVFSVRDLGSLNGTYLDNAIIDGEVPLRDGQDVQVGKFRLTFYASRRDLAGTGE